MCLCDSSQSEKNKGVDHRKDPYHLKDPLLHLHPVRKKKDGMVRRTGANKGTYQ